MAFNRQFFIFRGYTVMKDNVKKIAVIGSPGSGKTTLTKKLGSMLKLPIYHLDHHFWEENWQGKDEERWGGIVKDLSSNSEWIIDGDYFNTIKMRMDSADMIVYLNFSKWLCLWRICKRLFLSYGKTRSDMPAGCKEKLNWQFINFVKFVWDYHKIRKPIILDMLKSYRGIKTVYIFKNNEELDNFCHNITKKESN